MPIIRKTRLRPGSVHPTLVKSDTGLIVDENTGELSGELLVQEDIRINTRIDDLYWKDPILSNLTFETKDPSEFRIGEAFFSHADANIYIYVEDLVLPSADRADFQPQSWIDANRTERFLKISAGIDAETYATKQYVDTEIANLIGGAPGVLDTLQELVDAINNDPNFGASILAELARLEQVKADKDDYYDKTEIDTLELELLAAIQSAISKFSNTVDYVCGTDVDDDDSDLSLLWAATKNNVTFATPKNYLLKQNITTPVTPPIVLDRGYAHFLGFHPTESENKYSHINNIIVDISVQDPSDPIPVLSFTNISFNRFLIEASSNECVLIFNDCIFEQAHSFTQIFENQKLGLKVYFNKCKFNTTSDSINLANSEYLIQNSSFTTKGEYSVIFSNVSNAVINNSKFEQQVILTSESNLNIEKCSFKQRSDLPFVNISQDSLLILQRATFDSPESYSSYYISGTGTAYFDYNIVDISLKPAPQPETRVKQPTASPQLNNGVGADIYHFLDPLGSANFFYNDEKARDAIGVMMTTSVHDTPVTFTYDDNTNSLSLSLSLSTSDLSDSTNIAYLNQPNVFTQTNTFPVVQATEINTSILTATTSIDSPVVTTTTLPQTSNDTNTATTEYVRTAIDNLVASLATTELGELGDVAISNPQEFQALVYVGGPDPTSQWVNLELVSTYLADSNELVRVGDSVFKLSRIQAPAESRQTGNAGYTGGYTATNQILHWNGEYVLLPGTDIPSDGAYVPTLSNDVMLYAERRKFGTTYDGAGKIWIAEPEEVRDGTSNNKAVVPADLYDHYARTDFSNIPDNEKQTARDNLDIGSEYALHDMSNIPDATKQNSRDNLRIFDEYLYRDFSNITDTALLKEALDLPDTGIDGDILEWSGQYGKYINVNRVLSYTKYSYIDFSNTSAPGVYTDTTNNNERFYFADQGGSYFYNINTKINETNYLVLPTLSGGYDALTSFPSLVNLPPWPRIGPIVVRKTNGSTHETGGTISLICGSNNDKMMTSDNIIITNTPGVLYGQAQVDLLHIGHTVTLWPMIQDGDLYWYVEGYYYNSADQMQPLPTIIPTPEAIQDAIQSFFDHNYHSSSIAIAYDDPNHRLVATQFFATQDQVNAGIVTDLPIAPDTFKNYIDNIQLTNQNTYLAKAENLADLPDVSTARDNLELGTAALEDIGFNATQIPTIGTDFIDNGYVKYSSADGGLITSGLPLASTLSFGISRIATLEEFSYNSIVDTSITEDRVVTVSQLHEVLETTNPYTNALKRITNSLFYISTNTITINAVINTYYSLSTDNGSISLYLPEITNQPLGSQIMVKYRNKISESQTVTIAPYTNQTIDGSFQPYTLNVEGQSILFILGVEGWEIN